MPLYLKRPLVFFDLETTGIDIAADKIVQISLLKLFHDNNEQVLTLLINPGMHIPAEASAVHGITDDDVRNQPNFQTLSNKIYAFLEGCDICGFNIHSFDLPLLRMEFSRLGIIYPANDISIIDAMVIFKKKERRDLTAAYRFYCNQELKGAHDAENDIRATKEVLLAQVERYNDIGRDVKALADFSKFSSNRFADITGKLIYNGNNELLFNFGKHRFQKVLDNKDYANWVLNSDFPEDTKTLIREVLTHH